MWTPEGLTYIRRLGVGGGASVHLLEDPSSGDRISLKLADESSDSILREAVLREVRILERIDYPGLPRVLDSGADDRRSWYTYHHVEGRPLGALGAAEDVESFDAVARGVFGALFVLHDLGWIHYDVSADNVLVGDPKDWSTATLIDLGHAGRAGRTLLGTPGYMAPEILRGEPGGPESDIFSAGVTLAEFALGDKLFGRRTQREIVSDLPAVLETLDRRIADRIGEQRADLILRCVNPDRRERLGDAFEALADLGSIGGPLVLRGLSSIARSGIPPIAKGSQARRELRDALRALRWESGSASALADRLETELATGRFDLGRFLAFMVAAGHVQRASGSWILCRFDEEWLAEGLDPSETRRLLERLAEPHRLALLTLAAAEEFRDDLASGRVGRHLEAEFEGLDHGVLKTGAFGPRLASPSLGAMVRREADPDDLRRARIRAAKAIESTADDGGVTATTYLRIRAGEGDLSGAAELLRHTAETGRIRESRKLAQAVEGRLGDHAPVPAPLIRAAAWARAEAREWAECRHLLDEVSENGVDVSLLGALTSLQLGEETLWIRGRIDPDESAEAALAHLAVRLEAPDSVSTSAAEAVRDLAHAVGLPAAETDVATMAKSIEGIGREQGTLWRFAVLSVLNALGRRFFIAGEYEIAKEVFAAGRAAAESWGMAARAALFMGNFANCLIREGDGEAAALILEESARRREELGDTAGAITVWGNLGVVRYNAGETDAALLSWERQAALVRESGHTRKLAAVQCRIACALQEIGSWSSAREAFESSIRMAQATGDRPTEILSRMNLCLLLVSEGRIARAEDALVTIETTLTDEELTDDRRAEMVYLRARIELEMGRPLFGRAATLRVLDSAGGKIGAAWQDLDENERVEIAVRNALVIGVEGDFRSVLGKMDLDEDERGVLELVCLQNALPELRSDADLLALAERIPDGVITTATAERIALFAEILVRLETERGRSPGQLVQQIHDLAHRAGLPGLLWRAHLARGLKDLRRGHLADSARTLGNALLAFRDCFVPGAPSLPASIRGRAEFRAMGRGIRILARRVEGKREAGEPVAPPEEDTFTALQEMIARCALDLADQGGGGGKWERGIEKVLAVTETLNTTKELDPLLEQVVQNVLELCDAEYGFMVLLDDAGAPSVKIAKGGFTDPGEKSRTMVSNTVIAKVITQGRSILIQNALDEEELVDQPSVQQLSLQSVMCAPLIVKGKLLGAILVDNRTAAGCFTGDDLRLLEVFASQAAIAIENSRLFADLAASYRSLEEAQERIVRSEKLKSLGVLAGGIAHDFNNLLMSILGNADLALMYLDESSPATQKVSEIKNASRLAGDLCSQLLAYSGKGQFVVGALDLSEAVRGVAKMVKVSVSKKVAITFDLKDGMPGIEGDATQIRQVILNLITNAAEACGDGEGLVSISTSVKLCDRGFMDDPHFLEQLPEGEYVCLEVSDTGCGMDEETRSRLFEPFYSTKFTGRGLGLSAVLGIVRAHRGTIRVDSTPGEGTMISVFFPVTRAIIAQPEHVEPSDEEWTTEGTVLLVDDEEMVLDVAREMLAEIGLTVLTARDGREAVEVFRGRVDEIDLVILDMNMPRMSGDEAFREIRRLKRDAIVVISSGYSEADTARAFGDQELSGFMEKPYEFAALRDKLRGILGNGRGAQRVGEGAENGFNAESAESRRGRRGKTGR